MKPQVPKSGTSPRRPGDLPWWVHEVWVRKVVQGQGTYDEYAAQYQVNRKTVMRQVGRYHRYQGRLQDVMGGEALTAYRARLEHVLAMAQDSYDRTKHELAKVGFLRIMHETAEKLATSWGISTSPQKAKPDEGKVPVRTILLRGRDVGERITVGDN